METSICLLKDTALSSTGLSKDQQEYEDFPYQSTVGSLMHTAIMTLPDITHTVQQVVQFMADPKPTHYTAVK